MAWATTSNGHCIDRCHCNGRHTYPDRQINVSNEKTLLSVFLSLCLFSRPLSLLSPLSVCLIGLLSSSLPVLMSALSLSVCPHSRCLSPLSLYLVSPSLSVSQHYLFHIRVLSFCERFSPRLLRFFNLFNDSLFPLCILLPFCFSACM